MEFHVSRAARQRYGFDGAPFATDGRLVIADLAAARRIAAAINETRSATGAASVDAGDLVAMALIDEALHILLARHREERDPRLMADALGTLEERVGAPSVERTLVAFADRFPPSIVASGELDPAGYVSGATDGRPNRELVLEELLLLWLGNANPATEPLRELIDDGELGDTAYQDVIGSLQGFLSLRPAALPGVEPATGADAARPGRSSLLSVLRAPAVAMPGSLRGQLEFIRERWGVALPEQVGRLVAALDVLREEEIGRWRWFHPSPGGGDGVDGGGPGLGTGADSWGGTASAGRSRDGDSDPAPEPEAFSPDTEWMPRLVLLAKSTYVWLDQLSRRYARQVSRLDEIPDEELDVLARRGFTGLWLIGIWQRSPASQRIKQLRGDADAAASAYSLLDYRIAEDLGGDAAYEDLRRRAGERGLRLASDMVPNHMGIDATWVVEHPERFLSLPASPYPAYSFTGPDLSSDGRVGIYLEDHYYEATDAAVVFKRVDRSSGDERYVYHGNDGTSTPWNDTAQLDYLRADVREAVIQTILEVARRFPIIRFDAAMTLAKRHIQRLWHPVPGTAGAIPSRAEHAMTREEFDARMPVEFWREVVDRVAAEVPGTLLLAEAFWLMEGYFVRTLGMHRVYNSAFMNMLRDERNAEYRKVIRDTLEFDPEILKRYVNFMNNPDERTAVDQFGTGDKYFGVATLLVTLPGLPMFGHGQVEGFTEKYGMEFRRARWDEQVNEGLVAEHERRLSPLLHRRQLFAEAREFRLFDLVRDDGSVAEDVFAYANRAGETRSLVLFHNRYADATGRVRAAGATDGAAVAAALGLPADASDAWLVVADAVTRLEYLYSAADVRAHGLPLTLRGYECRVSIAPRIVSDDERRGYARLAQRLDGRGVASVERELREMGFAPVRSALRELLRPERVAAFAELLDASAPSLEPHPHGAGAEDDQLIARLEDDQRALVAAAAELRGADARPDGAVRGTAIARALTFAPIAAIQDPVDEAGPRATATERWGPVAVWVLLQPLARVLAGGARDGDWFDAFGVWDDVAPAFADVSDPATRASRVALVRLLLTVPAGALAPAALPPLVADAAVRQFIGLNEYGGRTWVRAEPFEELIAALAVRDVLAPESDLGAALREDSSGIEGASFASVTAAARLRAAARAAGYDLDGLLASLEATESRSPEAAGRKTPSEADAAVDAEPARDLDVDVDVDVEPAPSAGGTP